MLREQEKANKLNLEPKEDAIDEAISAAEKLEAQEKKLKADWENAGEQQRIKQ